MILNALDWGIIVAYFVFSLLIGLIVARRAGRSAADTLARAIVRAMLHAQTVGATPSYKDKYPAATGQ